MKYPVRVEVDGREYSREVEARMLLSEFLREELGLTSVRVGCDRSSCGSCTVLLDGLAVRSCTVLTVQVDGRSVTTIDGLCERSEEPRVAGALHPIQAALVDLRTTGCGYCSPGIVVAADHLRSSERPTSRAEIGRAIDGNACRCVGRRRLQAVVELALDRSRRPDEESEGTD